MCVCVCVYVCVCVCMFLLVYATCDLSLASMLFSISSLQLGHEEPLNEDGVVEWQRLWFRAERKAAGSNPVKGSYILPLPICFYFFNYCIAYCTFYRVLRMLHGSRGSLLVRAPDS